MKGFVKWLVCLAACGSIAGLLIVFLRKRAEDEAFDFTEEEHYDFPSKAKPVTDREYVSLNRNVEETQGEPKEDASTTEPVTAPTDENV